MTVAQRRLSSVDAIRAHQRSWLKETRQHVQAGGPFAICNADDFEEVFTAFDIPALVINYWNSIVTFSERKGPHYDAVLRAHGFEPHRFAHGLGTTFDPSAAPWGGLAKPLIIVGTTRDEAQLRVTELWAEAFGCECYPLDFSWVSQFSREPPSRWWERHRDRCETMLDMKRVELRLEQIKGLIAHLEAVTGRPFSLTRFREIMERLNAQMDEWERARDVMAAARPLPVSLRDQMAAYQLTWQRGSETNLKLTRDYREEVESLAARGAKAYPEERFRLYLATSGNDPQFHAYLREAHGGAIVSNRYSSVAPMYARTIVNDDPLRALAARQLFLFDKEPQWEIEEAKRWGCDGMISLEPDRDRPSYYKEACEAAGLAHLGLPADIDNEDTRRRVDAFVRARMTSKGMYL
jgi:benzoyl-CoA reductase subunit B